MPGPPSTAMNRHQVLAAWRVVVFRPHREAWLLSRPVVIRHGPMGLVHVDAHMDVADKALGEKLYHGTPFRRCVDEGLLDCKRVVQIGIRGSSMTLDTYRYSRSQVTGRKPLPLSPAPKCLPLHCPLSGGYGFKGTLLIKLEVGTEG